MKLNFIRRLWLPLALSLCIVSLSELYPSINDASGITASDGVSLELPAAYIASSPVSRTLDALTLLSNPQSTAVILTLVAIVLAWSLVTRKRWIRRLLALLAFIALIEAAVAFAPRPMARLEVTNPALAIVDFHSHTGASHDVRKSFTAKDNRNWHRSGGFDIAFITDHVTFQGAVDARRGNPKLAGNGTSLLMGVEGRYHRIMSTIMLGLTEHDTSLLNKRGNLLPGIPAAGRGPTTIVALPNRNLDSVTIESLDSLPRFVAIELIDAAPRGLGQFDRDENKITRMASNFRFTLVAASNNHGFGRAVAAWNLVDIPGWRALPPDSAGKLIEQTLRDHNSGAVKVVARTRPHTHDLTLPLTLPLLLVQMFGSLTISERGVWLIWIWGLTLLAAIYHRRNTRST